MEKKKILLNRGALLLEASKKIVNKVIEDSACIPSNACGANHLFTGIEKQPVQHEELPKARRRLNLDELPQMNPEKAPEIENWIANSQHFFKPFESTLVEHDDEATYTDLDVPEASIDVSHTHVDVPEASIDVPYTHMDAPEASMDISIGQIESNMCELGQNEETSPLKTHKRKQKCVSAKVLRQSGQSYVSRKGKLVSSPKFIYKICKCHMKCKENFSLQQRQEVFDIFWKLGSWHAQSNFISLSVLEKPCKRKYATKSTKRMITREYNLQGVKVCQSVFISTLGISRKRVNYCLKRKSKLGVCSPDKRGKNSKRNGEETIISIREFLNKFPKYHSHYSLVKRQYFSPTLSKVKIHDLYVKEMKDQSKKHVSYPTFNKIFKEYNVGIYIRKKDTCQLCDRLNIQIKANSSENAKEELHCHQMRAQYAREKLQKSTVASKQCPDLLSFTFDMEKTQPLPYLNTSVAYYKRQLWLYNFGINTRKDNQGYMYMWVENEGKRGSREICSCILEFLRSQEMDRVSKLSSFSDSCGGQNRNRNVIAFMMYICRIYNVEWEHTYLESGHSYLPNDADFAVIERKKNKVSSIYSVNEWVELVETAKSKNPFKIIRMNEKMLDFDQVTNEFTFRSTNTENESFSWLKMKYLKVNANSKVMEYKTTNDLMAPSFTIDFSKRNEKPLHSISLKPAYIKGVPISKVKYDDLQSLLPYIPPCHHKFYKDMPHNYNQQNDSAIHPHMNHEEQSN